MDTVTFSVNGTPVTISMADQERVAAYRWHMWGKYPYSNVLNQSLHHFIIGPKSSDVPADYVLDHINRTSTDASQPNLRWVSPSFNAWNSVVDVGISGYRGVKRKRSQWMGLFRGKSLGCFQTEREAFIEYARACVREWPLWAPTSDLLVGEGLLSVEEMGVIQKEDRQARAARNLPRGVFMINDRFQAKLGTTYLGCFASPEEASIVYETEAERHRQEAWEMHLRLPIPTNAHGDAVIQLSGSNARGAATLVPRQLWHFLTFNHSWCLSGKYAQGTWNGRVVKLHHLVYTLLNPFFVFEGGISVDHVNHQELDNREDNLRAATRSMQARNKRKREGTSSKHVGVSYHPSGKWHAEFQFNRARYSVGYFATEEEALLPL